MSNRVKAALVCALVGIGCALVAVTASGAAFVGVTVVKAAVEQVNAPEAMTVISDAQAGYDQAAYDACVDSAEDVSCE